MEKIQLAIHELSSPANVILCILATTIQISFFSHSFAPEFHSEFSRINSSMPRNLADQKKIANLTLFPSTTALLSYLGTKKTYTGYSRSKPPVRMNSRRSLSSMTETLKGATGLPSRRSKNSLARFESAVLFRVSKRPNSLIFASLT